MSLFHVSPLFVAGFADVWDADFLGIYMSLAAFLCPGDGQEGRFCGYLSDPTSWGWLWSAWTSKTHTKLPYFQSQPRRRHHILNKIYLFI